jgi:multidrug resistance protein, MATE family
MSTSTTSRPTLLQLLTLAAPMVIARSAQTVVGFTDTAMVARLGETALSASSTGGMNAFNFLILPMGIMFVVQTFSAQFYGQDDVAAARRYAWCGLVIAAAAQLLVLCAYPLLPALAEHLPIDEAVRAPMLSYMKLRLLSALPAIGMEALGAHYGGLGNTTRPMIAQVIAMVLNVLLNVVFIYGVPALAIPAMGTDGAAIASSLATWLAFFAMLFWFSTHRGLPKPAERSESNKDTSKIRIPELQNLLKIGFPAGLNWFVEFTAFTFFINIVMGELGTTYIAAFMAVLQLSTVAFMPAFALSSAGAIFVGQAIGKKQHDNVPHAVWLTMRVAAVWMMSVALLFVALPQVWLRAIAGPDASILFIDVGIRVLWFAAAWQLADAVGIVLAEALRAAGDTAFTFWARASIAWGIFVPGAWWSVHKAGGSDVAAVSWLLLYLALLSVVLVKRFRSGRWRHLDITTLH